MQTLFAQENGAANLERPLYVRQIKPANQIKKKQLKTCKHVEHLRRLI